MKHKDIGRTMVIIDNFGPNRKLNEILVKITDIEHIEYDENYEFWSVSFKLKKPFHCRNKYFKNFLFSKFSYDCVKSNSRIRQLIQARKMKEVK